MDPPITQFQVLVCCISRSVFLDDLDFAADDVLSNSSNVNTLAFASADRASPQSVAAHIKYAKSDLVEKCVYMWRVMMIHRYGQS